jgi:GDPmannose 4,6-dehydratase
MKKAIITGITGQDGSYLAELLLEKGYEVIGLVRRTSNENSTYRIDHIKDRINLVEGEISDSGSVYSLVEEHKPDEIYNLAAQSHVGTSFHQPDYTFQVDALGPLYFLQAIHKYSPKTRFYQASTSELFGKNFTEQREPWDDKIVDRYQDEDTEFMPQSPYAVAKQAAHNMVRIYREGYGIHASCGILFNHESERRGENFVTRKITKWIGEFVKWGNPTNELGQILLKEIGDCDDENMLYNSLMDKKGFPKLRLGNLDAYRDWGHAKDYVEAMWLMTQQEVPDDYVISTGETYSVRDFLKEAFNEIGIEDFEPYIVIDPKFYRPAEVEYLKGCSHKAREVLGWNPKISFNQLVKQMVRSDIDGKEKRQKV